MKNLILIVCFTCECFFAFTQTNPFSGGTIDSIVYEHYLNSRDCQWLSFKDSVLAIKSTDKRKNIAHTTLIVYNLASSIEAACVNKNMEEANNFIKKCDEIIKLYPAVLENDPNENSNSILLGDQYFYTYPMNRWRADVNTCEENSTQSRATKLPVFNIPIPETSCRRGPCPVNPQYKNLGELDKKLSSILIKNGYEGNFSYFRMKGDSGFAIVTRLELLSNNSAKPSEQNRWTQKFIPIANLSEYLASLFFSKKGYFRFMVFVLNTTTNPIKENKDKTTNQNTIINMNEVTKQFLNGENALSKDLLQKKLLTKDNYRFNIIIYEFEFDKDNQKGKQSKRFSIDTHLKDSNLAEINNLYITPKTSKE
jgi:hypothetical protein